MNTYSSSDPRSQLSATAPATASATTVPYAEKKSGPSEFAAAEYVKFYDVPPSEVQPGARTWYSRGQNFIVAYSEVASETIFTRKNVDEYFVILLEKDSKATLSGSGQQKGVGGYTISIIPPGESSVKISRGMLVRVISTRNDDLVAECSNAKAYANAHPNIPPFKPWPDPPDGFRIRSYSLDVPPKEGRFGRIWRSTTMMINVLPHESPRDVKKLSPHHHDDFEQGSLALGGSFTHHIRWPWIANMHQWRNDDHEVCPAPSIAVIPPPAIHTSAATDPSGNQLVDIFSPPRVDFSKMDGWVLNADEYPMP
jgi:hypothetical protein